MANCSMMCLRDSATVIVPWSCVVTSAEKISRRCCNVKRFARMVLVPFRRQWRINKTTRAGRTGGGRRTIPRSLRGQFGISPILPGGSREGGDRGDRPVTDLTSGARGRELPRGQPPRPSVTPLPRRGSPFSLTQVYAPLPEIGAKNAFFSHATSAEGL